MQKFDDVWFTYKARIEAEVRLKNSDFYSQILLVWYATLSSAASIVVLRHEKFLGSNTDVYAAVLSIAVLAVSMFVATRDFRGRALQMRANHIALKRFFDELKAGTINEISKPELYAKYLLECENHSTYDDRYFRVFNSHGLTNRKPTKFEHFYVWSMCSLRCLSFAVFFLLPLSVIWI